MSDTGADVRQVATLSEFVSRVVGGGTPARSVSANWNGSIPWVSVKDLRDGQLTLTETQEHISPRGLQASAASLIPIGTPIVCTRMAVGRAVVPFVDVAINQDLKALFPTSGVDSRYLLHGLNHLRPKLDAIATGSTVRGIKLDELLRFELFKPDLPTQQMIAAVLDAADNAISETERIIAKLRLRQVGLADTLLSSGIDGDGRIRDAMDSSVMSDTFVGPRPRGWQVAPLGRFLARSDYGISSSLSDSGRVPVLRMNNLANGEAKLDDLKYSDSPGARRLLLRTDDVLFNRTNSLEHVGRTGIWRGQLEVASFASYLVRLVPTRELTNEYLNRLLNLRQVQIDLRRWATPGVHQVNVNPTNLKRVVVSVPSSLDEQRQICDILRHADEAIQRELHGLNKLRAIREGLSTDLISGRVSARAGASND